MDVKSPPDEHTQSQNSMMVALPPCACLRGWGGGGRYARTAKTNPLMPFRVLPATSGRISSLRCVKKKEAKDRVRCCRYRSTEKSAKKHAQASTKPRVELTEHPKVGRTEHRKARHYRAVARCACRRLHFKKTSFTFQKTTGRRARESRRPRVQVQLKTGSSSVQKRRVACQGGQNK